MESSKLRLANRLRRMLPNVRAGAGSLVLASAVLSAPPADAAKAPDTAIEPRIADLQSQLSASAPETTGKGDATQLAWWGNWHNWGYHPWWHNWPNWRNWHNWHNWRNY